MTWNWLYLTVPAVAVMITMEAKTFKKALKKDLEIERLSMMGVSETVWKYMPTVWKYMPKIEKNLHSRYEKFVKRNMLVDAISALVWLAWLAFIMVYLFNSSGNRYGNAMLMAFCAMNTVRHATMLNRY